MRRRALVAAGRSGAGSSSTGAVATGSGTGPATGRYSVNVEPWPSALDTWISPPSRRAISRLIDRPSPVPPKRRLIEPSACWNASKMRRSLSGGMPMPVSITENATTPSERASVSDPKWASAGRAADRSAGPSPSR